MGGGTHDQPLNGRNEEFVSMPLRSPFSDDNDTVPSLLFFFGRYDMADPREIRDNFLKYNFDVNTISLGKSLFDVSILAYRFDIAELWLNLGIKAENCTTHIPLIVSNASEDFICICIAYGIDIISELSRVEDSRLYDIIDTCITKGISCGHPIYLQRLLLYHLDLHKISSQLDTNSTTHVFQNYDLYCQILSGV